jgi:hypothetical protein
VSSSVDHGEFVVPRSMRTAATLAHFARACLLSQDGKEGCNAPVRPRLAISRRKTRTQGSVRIQVFGDDLFWQSGVLVGDTFEDHQLVVCSLQQGGSITVYAGA